MTTAATPAAVAVLAARRGETLQTFGPTMVSRFAVERFRQALRLSEFLPTTPDPDTLPVGLLSHFFRHESLDLAKDQRPRSPFGGLLGNPVNGGSVLRQHRAIRVGEVVSAVDTLHDVRVKDGRAGPLAVVTVRLSYRDAADDEVATVDRVSVFRELGHD